MYFRILKNSFVSSIKIIVVTDKRNRAKNISTLLKSISEEPVFLQISIQYPADIRGLEF